MLAIAAAFGLVVARVVALELHTHPPVLVVNAIPVALSELHFGHAKQYVPLRTVRERFEDRLPAEFVPTNIASPISGKSVNPAIRKVLELDPSKVGTETDLLLPEDKGIVDLVELGFILFGYRVESVMWAYFAILATSCLLYVAAFWRSPSRLLLLAGFLAMLYLCLPGVAYNRQLGSILPLRALPILSMVACLHCLLVLAGSLRARVGIGDLGLVALQVLLIAFALHLRSTTIWQVATVVGFGAVMLLAGSLRRLGVATAPRRQVWLAVGVVVGLTIAAYVGLQAYQKVALREYERRGEIATRVFWHSIFSGLAFQPEFAERYQLRIDDSSIYAATGAYLAETGRSDLWRDMGGEVPGFGGIQFPKYEPIVREMLFARCSVYVRECAEAIFVYKPAAMVGNIAWLYGLRQFPPNLEIVVSRNFGDAGEQVKRQYLAATFQMDQKGERAYLWTPIVLLVLASFAFLLRREARASIWTAATGGLGLLAGSTIPNVIGYPLAHTVLDPALATGMMIYFGVCCALAHGLPALLTRLAHGLTRRSRPC